MIIKIDNEEVSISPRALEVLRHLLLIQGEIEQVQFGSWACHFAGRRVTPELTKSFRSTEIPLPAVKVKQS